MLYGDHKTKNIYGLISSKAIWKLFCETLINKRKNQFLKLLSLHFSFRLCSRLKIWVLGNQVGGISLFMQKRILNYSSVKVTNCDVGNMNNIKQGIHTFSMFLPWFRFSMTHYVKSFQMQSYL